MKIVYTAEPIEGIVESAHPPIKTRVAKEKLKAVIEEVLIPMSLVESYTITDDREFSFPFEMPNAIMLDGFFGDKPDYNLVAKELKELFEQPRREYVEFEAKLKTDLETATDQQILEMVERFHYTPEETKKQYFEALSKVRELWKPYEQVKADIEAPEYNGKRGELVESLAILNNCHVQGLLQDIRRTQELLETGKRNEAVEEVKSKYSNWRRENLAHLYNTCGDAKFYGAGFWIARMLAPMGEVEVKNKFGQYAPRTVEKALDNMRMPHQTIQL